MSSRFMLRVVGVLVFFAACVAIPPQPLRGETKAERHRAAENLVAEALHREVYGDADDREQLLREALAKEPNLAAANWHLGRVKEKGRWIDFKTAAAAAQTNPLLGEYRRRREQIEDTVAGHLSLADWCGAEDLAEQERAHLWRVVELSPNHPEARRRLGHIQLNGQWLTAQERREEFERLVAARQALAKWRPEMREIVRGLNRRGQAHREAAEQKLRAIDDPSAIRAMEEVICPLGEQASQLVVEVIATMDEHQASLALARHAVFSPHASVRGSACEALKQRRPSDFVPALLAELQTPVATRSQIYRGRGGSLVCRQVLARESQDHRDLAVLETEYQRIARVGGDRNETLARALADVRQTALVRQAELSRENAQTMAMNRRVMHALEESTGQVLPPTPQNWWQWWNDENEVFVPSDKPIRQHYQRDEVALVDRVPQQPATGDSGGATTGGQVSAPSTTMPRYDCLAAGTKVWTDLGAVAIEEIRVGDRVLSQDPETGELAYKPVIGTTIRPAGRLVRIEAGQDAITTSGGHLYWTSGNGWQKARDLASGAELHSVRGSVRISRVSKAELAPTYNVIVADFHTYFVGKGLVLCHDNTVSDPTDALVPGLSDY